MYPQLVLFSGVHISTYFLLISIATTIGVLWHIRRAEKMHLSRISAIDFSLVTLAGGFLGARLLHVIHEEPEYYHLNPWAVLHVWNGGFVFFGGLLGALVAALLFCRIRREPFWLWADAAALPLSFTYAIGRIGCFLNGCCYGKPADVPWAVTMHGAPRYPTQLFATAWELLALIGLLWLEPRLKISGVLFNLWLLSHSVGRVVMETFRDDPRGPTFFGVSIGTVLSLMFGMWALFNLVSVRWPVSRD